MSLIEAVRSNDLDQVNRLLLNPRVNINQVDDNGDTPLIWAALDGNVEIGQRLIESGADVNKVNHGGYTALHNAARASRKDFVVLLLEQPNISNSINSKTLIGYTALYLAVEYVCVNQGVNLDIVEMLLKSGADPNIVSANDSTPLTLAIATPKVDLIKLLVENGADVNQRINVSQGNTHGRPLLMRAVETYMIALKYLVTVPGLDIDATTSTGMTTLIYAAKLALPALKDNTISVLLSAEADPTLTDLKQKNGTILRLRYQ